MTQICLCHQFVERCEVNSSSLILCRSPMVDSTIWWSQVTVEFLLDNLRFDFSSLNSEPFSYERNPTLQPLNQQDPLKAYRYNPGSFIQLEVRGEAAMFQFYLFTDKMSRHNIYLLCLIACSQGEHLDLAITKEEVVVLIGEGVCAVKTLTSNHLYCEPPPQQPAPGPNGKKREGSDNLPEFTVRI